MKRVARALCLALFATFACAGWFRAENASPARFEGKDTLLRPEGYREWIFVGSSLGLSYKENPDGQSADQANGKVDPGLYHNVYINPSSYKAFASSGKFSEGTILVLELASADVKREPRLQGSYQKEFVALEATVKDSKRFAEGWAYYSFDGPDGKPLSKAQPFAKDRCWSCHDQKAATDNVFTQFYPVLRAVAPKQ
jgi:Cytochrome P460